MLRIQWRICSNMQVKIIESDMERCRRLIELVDDRVMVINGDARDPELLISEGIDHTDAFIALSDNSETNISACLSAKRSGVYRTVAEIENIDYISMAESMDIGTVINKKKLAASTIFQMMLKTDVSSVKCLTFIQAVVAEFPVNEGAPITRKPVKDLGLPQGANIGGLIRNGEGLRVSGNTMIQADDHVIIFCLEHVLKKLEKYFS
ncbi:MAG: NAD-binding protein [Bacteroidaceae bacterium]|nr:NAD-binding protein [Bacteroidaceae bacterium]